MSSRRARKPQCSQEGCASRRFNVGDDGFTYCDRGHQQSELGTVIAEDTGELVIQGTKSRKKDSDAESFASRVSGFSGPKAFEHYLLCIQLVLRKQLRWLVDVQKLPDELESLVRDLWALRLRKVQSKVSYDSETDTEAQSSQMFSSQSEGDTDGKTANSQRTKHNARKVASGPNLMDLLCLDFTAFLLLRIPLTVADLTSWVNDGTLCYYRASKEIPLLMRERLPGHLQEQLEPQDLVAPETLQRKILEWLTTLADNFGMAVPPVNHPLLLYRWVTELSLPLEVFVATQRLARVLDVDYSYRLNAKAGTLMSLRCPEIRLMALVVTTTKLLFPFDNGRRYPTDSNDLGALRMDWKMWSEQQQNQDPGDDSATKQLSYKDAFSMTEAESLDLAGESLDQYLDWCENNIAAEEVRERGRAGREADFRRTLFRMFPTTSDYQRTGTRVHDGETRNTGRTSAERLRQVQGALRPERIVIDEGTDDIPRAGSSYPQYRIEDDLDGVANVFYTRASQLAGTSLHDLLRAVFSLERRLMDKEKALRKGDSSQQSTNPS
ncbi:unnamed protein product [Zymoseptoria tritici ST99CH_3D7]|uniref:Uncharacterized protein n=2 Tax=Zymoseptoria tritici TaxID=1047171 RepID=A0A1X7S5Q5_ZYMT9|nr:unnamed protein product [Zymoseptoria tritici ST99CH_3D7]SMR59191.1 unnamed protein product [Zymoseptoria tritici ST99CH_1E4]